jgi:mannose-6-phosphate isomerase-like protein (cupin superfamily)
VTFVLATGIIYLKQPVNPLKKIKKGNELSETRLVVTGQNAEGKSVIVSDGKISAVSNVIDVTPLWGADGPPVFPLSGERPEVATLFPALGGYRFLIMTIPPDADLPDMDAMAAPSPEDMRKMSGAADWLEPDAPGMHTTDTVDFEVVLSGEASQEFDDGVVVHLKAGDCFVQNGTRHRWFNRGDVPAVVAVVLVGGHPRQR